MFERVKCREILQMSYADMMGIVWRCRCGKSVNSTSVRMIQGKVDQSDPVLISLSSSVVQYRSSTAHAESAEQPVC